MKKWTSLIVVLGLCIVGFTQEKATTNVLVTDFEDVPIVGAQIQFFNTEENNIIEGVSDEKGELIVALPAGLYNIRLKSVGKSKDYNSIEIPKLGEREIYNNVNIVIQYAEETSFTLSDLHFKTGESIIEKSSLNELDELVNYLKLKKGLKIEIGGHTDNNGSESSNLVLSKARAEAVKKYLTDHGIAPSRLTAKGYGESMPIAENNTERGKSLNRRTEINILK